MLTHPADPAIFRRHRLTFGATVVVPCLLALAACSSQSSHWVSSGAGGNTTSGNGGDGTAGAAGTTTWTHAYTHNPTQTPTTTTSKSTVTGSGTTVNVQILAFNDFHGNLLPPSPSNGAVLALADDVAVLGASPVNNGDGTVWVQAGGVAYFAAHLAALRQKNPNTLVVSAGDLTGAAPLLSNAYGDEPTVDIMNTIGIDLEGVGNHDFDHGAPGVLRFQNGGCNPTTDVDAGRVNEGSCVATPTFPGATFKYLAANVDVSNATQADIPDGGPTTGTLFPPYEIKTIGGANIAFIGMTLNGTPALVSSHLPGLTFQDEVATANELVPVLQAKNVDAIVVLLHQGGFQTGTYNNCVNLSGSEIIRIAQGLDPAITIIHSAHTHVAYNCTINGRPVMQAASFGRIITQYKLTIDTGAHVVTSVTANNIPVTRDVTPDRQVETQVTQYYTDIAPLAGVVEGYISGDFSKSTGANGECQTGDVITDGMLFGANQYAAAHNITSVSGGAQPVDLAFTNIGGIRDGLFYKSFGPWSDGQVTYQETQAIMPFGDIVQIVKCSSAAIMDVVQQNTFVGDQQLLQQSGLTYTWRPSLAATTAVDGGPAVGSHAADESTFYVNGVRLVRNDTTQQFNVATIDFLASGGDSYTAFSECSPVATVGVDLSVFNGYFNAKSTPTSPLAPTAANRITMGD